MPTLFHKVWNAHAVRTLPSGQTQLFVGLHLVHEVTSPQAFDMLRQHGWRVAFPERTFATVDHIVPDQLRRSGRSSTDGRGNDVGARAQLPRVRHPAVGARDDGGEHQGIVHVIGPELGLTQPGMTIACGDSHTSTHGALGAIAFGIGTSQVRDVLASQCLALEPLKVRRIDVNGQLRPGVYAKDVILTIIRRLGVQGGVGFAYEYGGRPLDRDDHRRADDRSATCRSKAARASATSTRTTRRSRTCKGRRFAPQGDGVRPRGRLVAADRVRPGRAVRRPRHARRGGDRADGHLGHQPGAVGRHQRADRRRRRRRSARVHGVRARAADRGHEDRRRVHRLVHQRPPVGSRGGGAARARPPRGAARQGAGRAGLAGSPPRGGSARACTRSSRRPGSNGAAPAARCAWR